MKFLENIICKYYEYNIIVLGIISIVCIGMISRNLSLNWEEVKKDYKIIVHKVLDIFAVSFLGTVLYVLGLKLDFEYPYFNVMIFLLAIGSILIYGIVQGKRFNKRKYFMMQVCRSAEYVVLFEILLLIIRNNLNCIEFFTGVLAILCLEMFLMLEENKEPEETTEVSSVSDYPNSNLFPKRKIQLEKFIPILEEQKKEPYAIMISGEWGVGKSSFVKALKEKQTNDYFILIRAGSEKSVAEIMKEISGQIVEILKENGIFIENGGVIEKYFIGFSDILEEGGLKILNKMLSLLNNKNEDGQEYLNNKLRELDKTIFLVVDDLDRCGPEYQQKMFKVIRESMELVNCKVIFLVDKTQFLKCDNNNYIEKYISYTLDICEVEGDEILEFFIDDIIETDFVERMNNVLLKNRNTINIRKLICEFPDDMLSILGIEIAKASNNLKNDRLEERDKNIYKARIADITETVLEIRKNITNARKVKNYLKGIKIDIGNISTDIDDCSIEYKEEDWLKAIIEVQFLKNFLPELYAQLRMSIDFFEFHRKYKGSSIEIIFGMNYGFMPRDIKKETILNHIIYNVDVIDFSKVKTEKELYLGELYNNPTIDNIFEYLEYANTYEDFNRIMKICIEQGFVDFKDREEFITSILSIWSRQSYLFKADNSKFYDLSKQMIECISKWDLSDKEKNICEHQGKMIIRRIIVDNTHFLRTILLMLFDVSVVETYWQPVAVTDVDEFFSMLKRIDCGAIYKGLEDEIDKLLSIRQYYENLAIELRKEKYTKSGLDFDRMFNEMNLVFDTCVLWNNIGISTSKGHNTEEMLIKQYFILEGGYYTREVVFEEVSNLEKALKELNVFLDKQKESYEPNYTLMLMRLAHQIVSMYETKPEWFTDGMEDINNLLNQAAEKCYLYDKMEDIYAKQVVDQLRVFVYRFDNYSNEKISSMNKEEE